MKTLLIALVCLPALCNCAEAQLDNPFDAVLARPQELKPQPDDDQVTALLKQNVTAAHREMRYRYNYWLQDIGGVDALLSSINRLEKLCLQLSPEARIPLMENKLAFAKELEKRCEKGITQTRSAALRELNEACVTAFRLATELELAQLKSAAVAAKGDKATQIAEK